VEICPQLCSSWRDADGNGIVGRWTPLKYVEAMASRAVGQSGLSAGLCSSIHPSYCIAYFTSTLNHIVHIDRIQNISETCFFPAKPYFVTKKLDYYSEKHFSKKKVKTLQKSPTFHEVYTFFCTF
jgi:hypothetical protein